MDIKIEIKTVPEQFAKFVKETTERYSFNVGKMVVAFDYSKPFVFDFAEVKHVPTMESMVREAIVEMFAVWVTIEKMKISHPPGGPEN